MSIRKFIVGVVLSCCIAFCGIGYAMVSTSLEIDGDANATPQTGVFIQQVIIPDGVDLTVKNSPQTTLSSTLALDNDLSSTATYEIKVYNNSQFEYTFNGAKYMDEAYDNGDIVFEVSGIKKGDVIKGGEYLTFSVKFAYGNVQSVNNAILNSVINYEFVPKEEDIPEIVVSDALGKFKQILNTPEDYTTLINQMDDSSDRANNSYIGNVVGAKTEDTNTLNTLFTEGEKTYLTLVIGGQQRNITAMIKREDVDGKSNTGDGDGNEMTIYMTAENPKNSSSVTVFSAVFTKEGDGEWYQLGQMYEGSASTNSYSGSWFASRDSFNTDRWRSTVNYYQSGTNRTIKQLTASYLASIK